MTERAQDDSQALVTSQQDQSHVNPAYDGGVEGGAKPLELKEMGQGGEGSGAGATGTGDAKAEASPAAAPSTTAGGQNGDTPKETTTT